jgi:hypothetical protein
MHTPQLGMSSMFSFSFEHVVIGDMQGVYSTLKFTTLGRLEIDRNSTHIPNQKTKNKKRCSR